MDFIDSLYERIDAGMLGKNIGIPTGLSKLDDVIGGIQKATYSLVFAGTSVGKTSFVLYSHIYKPLMDRLGDLNFRIVYYSLEMTAEILLAKLLSLYIWETYGEDISFTQILSRRVIMSEHHYAIVKDARTWLVEVMKHLTIYDKTLTSGGLYANLKNYAKAHGTFEEGENTTKYIPHRPDETVVVILDHIFLVKPSTGQTEKQAVDMASAFLIVFRNKCQYSPVVLQQLNRNSANMDRRKAEMQEPELGDLKGSGNTSEDCDLAIALYAPFRVKVNSHVGYKIDHLRDAYRAAIILKNRYGEVDKMICMNFFGKVGLFRELPPADEIGPGDYWKYKELIPVEPSSQIQAPSSFAFTL